MKQIAVLVIGLLFVGGGHVPSFAQQQVRTPYFSLAPGSPSQVLPVSAADIFETLTPSGFAVEVNAIGLTLNAALNIDAISGGNDWVDPNEPCPVYPDIPNNRFSSTFYFWSVDPASKGAGAGQLPAKIPATGSGGLPGLPLTCTATGSPIPPEDKIGEGLAGDIFWQFFDPSLRALLGSGTLMRFNEKLHDEARLGLIGNRPDFKDDLDALQDLGGLPNVGTHLFDETGNKAPDVDVFFSLDRVSATALGFSPADILVLPAKVHGVPRVITRYATEADLGLQAGDNINALCVDERDDKDIIFNNGGRVAISLARNSPSLGGGVYQPGDVFRIRISKEEEEKFPGKGLTGVPFLPHQFLSLGPNDDLDALYCGFGDPGGEPNMIPIYFMLLF